MIITGISASNLLKYTRLELQDLPDNGVIAVSGNNESGKSSIGEVICFALYGRSFSFAEEDLKKMIHWGEFKGSVTLQFHNGDGKPYEVTRFIDQDGNIGARLGMAGDEGSTLARGSEAVTTEIERLLGYDFEEFLESFYLAQREIIAPHPRSAALKSIAGLGALEVVAEQLEGKIEEEQTSVDDEQQRLQEIATGIASLAIQPGYLAELEKEQEGLKAQGSERNGRIDELSSAFGGYERGLEDLLSAQGKRGAAAFLRFLMLILALASGAGWYFMTRQPDSAVTRLLAGFVPAEQSIALVIAAAVFAALFLLFMGRTMALNTQIVAHREPGKLLAEKLERIHRHNNEEGGTIPPATEAASAPTQVDIGALCERIKQGSALQSEVRGAVECELERMRGEVTTIDERIARHATQIDAERERVRQVEQRQRERNDLQLRAETRLRDNELREVALELLDGAYAHVLQRFNGDLRELAAHTLPMFTAESYEHLQIDEELRVRVFSNKKRDFMDLGEISAGTQRQIMLSLRLALAQELVQKAVVGTQFMFLDEPFAFFDEQRTRGTLDELARLSDEITQVWVVAQHFPDDLQFKLHIRCDGANDELVLTSAAETVA